MKARAPGRLAPAAPAVHTKGRPHLRVLGTEITLLEGVRRQAEKDLGISIGFELLDFLGTQQKAARQPAAFDIYDHYMSGPEQDALMEVCRARDVAVQTIKAAVRKPWGNRPHTSATWLG